MSLEIILVLIILIVAIILFATEYLSVDLVAILIMSALILAGILTPQEGVAGFSNQATITVAAMFILSAGLFKSGAVNALGKQLSTLFKYNFWVGVVVMMIGVGAMSAFINNTPVVAIMIPLVITAAAASNHPVSKLLMPLSFASMFGGVCTLIGTSTNILVSGIAEENGQAPFGMFEMTALGLIFFATGIIYMLLAGIRLIPVRKDEGELTEKFGMGDYLTEIILKKEAPSVGSKIADSPLVKVLDIDIIALTRDGQHYYSPSGNMVLRENDLLKVRCDVKKIKELGEREGIELKPRDDQEGNKSEQVILVEAVLAPNSNVVGKTLKQIRFRQRYNANVLAIRHRGEIMHEKLIETILRAGDTLLLEVEKEQLAELKRLEMKNESAFLILSEVGLPEFRRRKIAIAVSIIAGVVIAATFGILPIMTGAIIGSALMVLTGCLNMEEAYKSIEWRVIFLLAGALSLGLALHKTGTADLLSGYIISIAGSLGPIAIVSALYLITSLLTEAMSNNASAVLLAPIAIASAAAMDTDPRPFLMAITFAASCSFMTPVGYQTNTMIYGAGHYKFMDFVRVGTPLNIILWIVATLLIPVFFPF